MLLLLLPMQNVAGAVDVVGNEPSCGVESTRFESDPL